MMAQLAPQNARASKTIRHAYREHLDLLVLDGFPDLERALANGGLAPLPADYRRFNVAPRLDGPYPIAEKDLANQVSYLSARPATIGCLLDVASRVKSGPLEITSLVRHSEYQQSLKQTNGNANTSVPMHTMGLAFDIALVNTPLKTVYEIRDVLERMRDAGEILFIGERRQLVFHVVPQPSRLGYFTNVYAQLFGATGMARDGAPVVAFSPLPDRHAGAAVPAVRADVVAVVPTPEYADQWWDAAAADHSMADIVVEVSPQAALAPEPPPADLPSSNGPGFLGIALLAATGIVAALAWRFVARRPAIGVPTAIGLSGYSA